jgi:mersacidin/lichenicidin family type 2 lantibiotic
LRRQNNSKRKEKVMKRESIIRAWKDEAYRQRLTEAERAQLPANPAGSIELDDAALTGATGGAVMCTGGACPGKYYFTFANLCCWEIPWW